MNKFLPKMIASTTKNNNFPTKLLLVLLFSTISWMANAQCIGPYQTFESFKTGTVPTGWTFNTGATSFSVATSTTNARNGIYMLQQTGNNSTDAAGGNYPNVTTATYTNPKAVSFYVNRNAALGVALPYIFQYSPDNGVTWYTIPAGTNSVNGVSITATYPTIPTPAGPSGYYQFTALFNTNNPSASYKFKICDTRSQGTQTPPVTGPWSGTNGSLWIDDFSVTTYNTSPNDNIIIVPEWGAASTCNAVSVPAAATNLSYSFYDQGGVNDIYIKSQNETMYFAPSVGGEKVQLSFNSFVVDASTKITVYNGNGATLGTEFSGLNNVGTVTTTPATTVTSTDVSGYITVKFVTSSVALSASNTGYDITVKCVAPPTITSLGASSGCDGGSLVINGTNLTGATAANVTIGATAVLSAVVSGGGTVLTVVPANGSSGTVSVTTPGGTVNSALSYTSNSLPTITGTLSACIGNTTQLTGSATAAASNPWGSSNTGVATVSSTGLVTGVSAGSATITYTNTNGCSITALVTINALPTITGTLAACIGNTTQLTGSATAAVSTPWVSSNTTVATVDGTGLITALTAGTSTITYTNTNGCANTAVVTINALPTLSGTLSACPGTTTQLTGSGTAAATNPWLSSNTAVATVNSTGLVTGVAAGTSTITYTNTNGCLITAVVTINPLPTITGTLSACIGNTTQLTGSATAAASNPWVSSNTGVASVSTTGLVTGISAGTTTITYTNTNGCSITASVTINASPTITGTLSACVGSSTQLTGSATAAATNPWVSSNTAVATVSATGLVAGLTVGSTTITYTNTNGCLITATVTINALPTITGTLSACTGNSTQLTGSATAAATNPWVSSNTAVATVNGTGLVTGVTAGSTTITYTNSNGCVSTASVTITTTAIPTASAGTTITNTSFTANWSAASGATGYYLDVSTSNTFATFLTGFNGLSVGNVTTYGISGLTSGVTYYYRVKATGSCGISAYSGTITVVTTSTTYCTPTAPTSTSYYINSFDTTGGITNITNDNTGFTAGGYANYSATLSCSQYAGSSVNFSIANTDTIGTYYYYVWIDWNNDGDFLDAGETIVATTNYSAGPYTGTLTIPGGQSPGSYRMRVSNDYIYANTSCTNGGYGEYEDYTLIVVPIPPCTVSLPSALTVSNIAATAATLSWSDASAAPSSVYDYYYNTTGTAPTGATSPNGNITGVTAVNLTGLTLGQTYYCWVRTDCSGTTSAWSTSANFTTISLDIINLNANGSLTTCNAKFYDSGGSGSSYKNNENYTYTFTPSAGSNLKAVFNSFSTESGWDGLVIYNGNSTAAPIISSGLVAGSNTTNCPAGSFYGTTSPGTIYSTAADGSLTFQFRSDGSITKAGWDVSLTCVTLPTITSFTPTSSCAGTYPLVTITGTNFTGATSVKFNGVTAAFTIVNSTTITATLPATATTGTITVSNAQATGTSTTAFSIYPVPPTPNAGSPASICIGDSIALAGTATAPSTTTVLSQDFNAGPFPSGWTRTSNDFQTSYEFVSSGNTWPANGYTGYCSYFWTYVLSSGYSSDMISPAMDLSSYSSSTLTFWIYNSSGTDSLNVYANNNGGAYTQVGTTYNTYGSWTQITISLNSFVGAGFNAVKIKFSGTSDFGTSNIGIDDIVVKGTSTVTNTWSSNPAGFTSSSLTPTVSPIVTTTYTLSSTYGNGCASTSNVVVTVNQKPTITSTLAVTALCASTSSQSASLNYTATTNAPTSYSIDWNAAANSAGLADQTSTTLAFVAGAGALTGIVIPANLAPNQYTGSLTITNAGGCTSSYTITINIGKVWNGTTSNDWGYANNWTPSGVPTSSDCVVIPSGTPYSPEISVNAFAGNLTINASASLSVDSGVAVEVQDFVKTNGTFTMNSSASLVQINNVANSGTGNMIYKRDVSSVHGYDYIYWSSPVGAQAISGLYNTPAMGGYQYYWDTLANNNNGASGNTGQGNWSTAYGTMQVGKGYIVRGASSYNWTGNLTANFTGIPNNGDLIMSVARGGYTGAPYSGANGVTISNQEDNYNLIGNPYPSAIKATDFLNWPSNTSKIQGVVYLWTHNSTPTNNANTFYSSGIYNYFTNDYLAYNNVGASSGSGFNGYIAAGQGFFVTMLDGAADASQSVTFNNSMRSKGYDNHNFFKGSQQATQASNEVDRIWLDLIDSNSLSTRTLVGYIDGATVSKDRQFDAYTPVGNSNIIYSLIEGDSHVIQGRPLPFDANDQVPLGYHSVTSGNFTIAIAEVDGLFAQGQTIYLEDKMLNVIYDLRQSPYVFATAAGTFNDRFVLRYTNSNLSNEQFATHSVAAFIANQKLQIKASSVIASVQIYDVAGKLIKTYTPAIKALEVTEDFPFANGVYFAKIKLDDGDQYIQKVMN